MLEELQNLHAVLQAAHEEGNSGITDGEMGDAAEERLAGIPLETIVVNPKCRKLCQIVMDAKEEDLRRLEAAAEKTIVRWDHPHDPLKTRIALREHAEKNGLTGWKPGLGLRSALSLKEE